MIGKGPTFQDWLHFVISLLFVSVGVFFLSQEPQNQKMYFVVIFFSFGLLVSIWTILRKRSIRADLGKGDITVAGHEPLFAKKGRYFLLGFGLLPVGLASILIGKNDSHSLLIIIGLIVLFASLFLFYICLFRLGKSYLQFEYSGFRVATKNISYLIHWNNIERVTPMEIADNDFLLIGLASKERLVSGIQKNTNPKYVNKMLKSFDRNLSMYGHEIWLNPFMFGTNVVILAKTMQRYIERPETRAELKAGGYTPHK